MHPLEVFPAHRFSPNPFTLPNSNPAKHSERLYSRAFQYYRYSPFVSISAPPRSLGIRLRYKYTIIKNGCIRPASDFDTNTRLSKMGAYVGHRIL